MKRLSRSKFVMGIGLGFLFVSLSSMAFATIKKEQMGNATSIFNLLRNIAGSFGIAFMTTMLARRAQFHQFRLVEKLNPFDAEYQAGLYKAMDIMKVKTGTASANGANGIIYRELVQQSNSFSFTDCFYLATVILVCIIPLVFFLKRQKGAALLGAH